MSNWKEIILYQISEVRGRVGWKGYTVKDLRDRGALTIGAAQINSDNKLNLSNAVYLSDEKYDESPEIIIEEGDLLLVQRGSLGKLALVDKNIGRATINPSLVILKNIKIDKKLLYYYLCSYEGQKLISDNASQTGVPMISQEQILNFKLRLPSKNSEQIKIAKILATADGVIEKTQAAIAKYKAIKQGMLQDLFTRGIDISTNKLRPRYDDAPELYKESNLGMIPREWEYKELGKCGTFRKGGNIPKYSLSHSGNGCVLYGQLYTTFDNIINKVESRVPISIIENMSPLKYGSILFAGSGETHEEIGKCAVLLVNSEDIYAGGDVVILDLYDEYFKPYFGYYLNFHAIQSQKSKFGQGSSVIHIYANHLSSVLVSLPPRKEQEKIFTIIDQLNNKLQTEQIYLQKMQLLKKGLMEDLLSGRKKVKVVEEKLSEPGLI